MEPLIGQVVMFAGTFAPRGWAFCDGSMLQIMNNQSLFSLLGTTYGGDGRTTFALPDLRGRAPVHVGSERHLQLGSNGNLTGELMQYEPGKGRSTVATPYLAINYIIAVQGIFPSRG